MNNLEIMNIPKDKLELLLERKRDSIGSNNFWWNFWANLAGGLSLIVSIQQFTHYNFCFYICLTGTFGWFFWTFIQTVKQWKSRYNHKKLFSDIESLDTKGHPFDLLIIQNKEKTKVLTFFDKRWNTYLFPYKRMSDINEGKQPEKRELEYVTGYLAELLQVSEENIHGEMVLRKTIQKYSVSDKVNKTYDHRFYKMAVDNLGDDNDFEIAGVKFKWWHLSDLETDQQTVKNNADIVAVVKNEVL